MLLAPLIAVAAIIVSIISYVVGVHQLVSHADQPERSLPPLMILAPLVVVVGLGLAVIAWAAGWTVELPNTGHEVGNRLRQRCG